MADNGIPFGTEVPYQVAKVEKKKEGEKDGRAYTIWKLGLIAPSGEKTWAELYCGPGSNPPAQGTSERLILTEPDNPKWNPSAKRPRRGGAGGGRGMSPEERARIERMHAQEMAVRLMAAFEPVTEGRTAKAYLEVVKELSDWFQRDTKAAKP